MAANHHAVAALIRSRDGGPLRRIINGATTRPTGVYLALKGGGRHMPWESKGAELPVLYLSDLSWRVASLLAQPHRLDMFVRGQRLPLQYIPDIELRADPSFVDEVCSGTPFGVAATRWEPHPTLRGPLLNFVLEVKDDDDPRNEDPAYQRKLALAKKVYGLLGYRFAMVLKSEDIDCVDMAAVREAVAYRFTQVTSVDTISVVDYLTAHGGAALLRNLVGTLGDETRTRAAAYALHFGRIICIDSCATPAWERRVSLIASEAAKC